MTIKTVLTMTLCTPPPNTGSEMTGSVSLTIMLANSNVTRSRCPFFRIGSIFRAYSLCFLNSARQISPRCSEPSYCSPLGGQAHKQTDVFNHKLSLMTIRSATGCTWLAQGYRQTDETKTDTHGVPLMLRTWSCVSSKLM